MTQAISLSEMLRAEGHEVVGVLVGKSERREIPKFFYDKINAPVDQYESPNFAVDASNKKIKIWPTITQNFLKGPTFLRSLKKISQYVKESKPDVIINFYELLGGLYALFYNPKVKIYTIGHQFLLLHPEFKFPKGFTVDHKLMNVNTFVTALRAKKYLALSFRPMPDVKKKKIYVVPPLLRPEVTQLTPVKGNYIHGYILNSGYAEDIEKWHSQHPEVELHFFWDKKDAPEELQVHPNLTFHRLNDVKFLDYMSKCGGYSSTAGFESICEAMYLGKPIMMVPTYGHFEQACNALDASIAGGGVKSDIFDLNVLLDYMPKHKDITVDFRKWADSSRQKFIELLTT